MPASTAPQSAVSFAALGVPAVLTDILDGQGITAPFPVQTATLPDALAGRDILGRARTGSGKTLGFSLPMVSRLAGRSTRGKRPRGLVLVPTRELATQVSEVLKPLARGLNLGVATIYGGVSYGPQLTALQRGTDIVVATPGRLADLIGQGECNLSDVEVTVIDEADQMADLGFLPVVRRLLETTPDGGQRMLFSATLDAAVDVLARRFLTNPVLHSVDENSSPAEIEHHVLTVDGAGRIPVIAALAGGEQRTLVFTRTKHGAERLARQLTQAGIPAAELHGNLRQGARTRNLDAFSTGLARVMVATDIAARGIHIDGIDLVVHADPPAEHKAYVHRSGRTARGGADGVVVTLQTRAQARDVTALMSKAGITPHGAVVADAGAEILAELAGPPAPRVTVSGKVAELVPPEDRLARNDRPGAGKPGEGRPRRDGGRRPRGERPARREQGERSGRGTRSGSASRGERTSLGADGGSSRREPGDRFERGARSDRSARPDRAERPANDGRAAGSDQGARDERGHRDDRGSRDPRGGRNERGGTPNRDERGGNDWYPHAGGRRSPGGRQGSQPYPGRGGRPQGGSQPGGSPRRAGNSAGRGGGASRRAG